MNIQLRSHRTSITPSFEAYVLRSIYFALDRISEKIRNVSVRFRDMNGPRGGIDKACTVLVSLRPGVTVVVDERAGDQRTALDGAVERAQRAVLRFLEHKQAKRRAGRVDR